MIFKDPEKTEQTDIRKKQIDDKYDKLSESVYNLVVATSALAGRVSKLESTADDRDTAIYQRLNTELTATIEALEQSYSGSITTGQLTADSVTANTADITSVSGDEAAYKKVTADSLIAPSANIGKATLKEYTGTSADINTAMIATLTATVANIANYNISELTADKIKAAADEVNELTANIATVERLNTDRITVSDGGTWHKPNTSPTNIQLLKLFIPVYQGVVNIVTQDREFNLTVIDNSLVSFINTASYLYCVEFNNLGTSIYLQNVGDTFVYKEIHIGDSQYTDSYSELVDKALYKNNINTQSGTVSRYTIITGNNSTLQCDVVDQLPDNLEENKMYIVRGGDFYFFKDDELTNVFTPIHEEIERKVAEERDRALAAEQVLQNNIDAEAATRLDEDNKLSARIDAIRAVHKSTSTPQTPDMWVYLTDDNRVFVHDKRVPVLDDNGRLPSDLLPVNALLYVGQWNPADGYPDSTSSTFGDFYIVNANGTCEGTRFYVGDWIIWNGNKWDRSANANAVSSVNGLTGAVTLDSTNIKTGILAAGNTLGKDLGDLNVKINQNKTAADTAIANETTARNTAVANEATARANADTAIRNDVANGTLKAGAVADTANIKTVNGITMVGAGNITLADLGITIVQ